MMMSGLFLLLMVWTTSRITTTTPILTSLPLEMPAHSGITNNKCTLFVTKKIIFDTFILVNLLIY